MLGPIEMNSVVRVEPGVVAVIVIDNPPINASSSAVRSGLLTALAWARNDAEVKALVLIGAGKTFVAGADIREFAQPLTEPQLPAVIAAFEACPLPIVAALHGTVLGGGLELALGCDARVALRETQVGLPEVTLGLIPGAGGTQRLPRLIGIPRAMALISTGERVGAEEALQLGLVDAVVATDVRASAIGLAATLSHKRRVRDLSVPAITNAEVSRAAATALRVGKNRPAVQAAVESVQASRYLPFDQALSQERASFEALRGSREARALRYQFFAEREAGKYPAEASVVGRPVRRIGVVGAGTMGTGIAITALDAGLDVTLIEREQDALARGVERIHSYYAARCATGKLSVTAADARKARLQSSLQWAALATADLIVEAVFEDLAVKQEVFRELDGVAQKGAILATNTSYLDIDEIARVTTRPQDVVGLHFFSPAQVMRLLEVVHASASSAQALLTALRFARELRKIPVVAANAFGFIGNRIYAAYRRQCEFLLEEGATPLQVDTALESFGFAMGPFAVGDLSGLDIAWRMRQATAKARDPADRYVRIPDLLCEAGRLGRKSGAGYYCYENGSRVSADDPFVGDLIAKARAEKGIVPRAIDSQEITQRALMAMVNEAAQLLTEGVAQRASDIDVALVNGYGFPRWEGGPVFWARERGAPLLHQDLEALAHASGPGFRRAEVKALLQVGDRSAG